MRSPMTTSQKKRCLHVPPCITVQPYRETSAALASGIFWWIQGCFKVASRSPPTSGSLTSASGKPSITRMRTPKLQNRHSNGSIEAHGWENNDFVIISWEAIKRHRKVHYTYLVGDPEISRMSEFIRIPIPTRKAQQCRFPQLRDITGRSVFRKQIWYDMMRLRPQNKSARIR